MNLGTVMPMLEPVVVVGEEFTEQATEVIRGHMDKGMPFVLVTSPDVRPYVRMIVERIFAPSHKISADERKSMVALVASQVAIGWFLVTKDSVFPVGRVFRIW